MVEGENLYRCPPAYTTCAICGKKLSTTIKFCWVKPKKGKRFYICHFCDGQVRGMRAWRRRQNVDPMVDN